MTTNQSRIEISGLTVQIVRKDIKNLHLGVYPPDGHVRVAVPRHVSNDSVRLAVIGKLRWIHRQKAKFDVQARQSEREMIAGETHYFLGRRYRLSVVCEDTIPTISTNGQFLELRTRTETTAKRRDETLQKWYREQLKLVIAPLIAKWQRSLGVEASEWRIKRMKTKWGTCNAKARRIWLNLELIKKPKECIEYVIVHELVHLIERHHNDRFINILQHHLPHWRTARAVLNAAPLAHEEWTY